MKSFTTILFEAIVVGLLLIPFTYVASRVLARQPMMELTLLLAGILFHLVFEYLGINKWYVDNYY